MDAIFFDLDGTLSDDRALADEVVRLFRVRFGDVGLFETEVYPGIPELLDRLTGRLHLFACTTKPFVDAVRVLQRLGFGETFDAVYGSELDGTRADKRDLLAHALAEQRNLARASTVLLGDRALDVAAAHANGVVPWAAGWGYGSDDELAGADHCFAFPREVADFIDR
jgi:phosphoglycolate phosphatase